MFGIESPASQVALFGQLAQVRVITRYQVNPFDLRPPKAEAGGSLNSDTGPCVDGHLHELGSMEDERSLIKLVQATCFCNTLTGKVHIQHPSGCCKQSVFFTLG